MCHKKKNATENEKNTLNPKKITVYLKSSKKYKLKFV